MTRAAFSLAAGLALAGLFSASALEPYDVALRGGSILDGTGSPAFAADIGIRNGKIVRIGPVGADEARRSIAAGGLLVTPGLVEVTSQSPVDFLDRPGLALPFAARGATTVVFVGERSPAPWPVDSPPERWQNTTEFLQVMDLRGFPVNLVPTVGQTTLREWARRSNPIRPVASVTPLAPFEAVAREAMSAGAAGICASPDAAQAPEEAAALSRVLADLGGRMFPATAENPSPAPDGESLKRAVAAATAGAANSALRFDRGRIAEGLAADLVAFDAAKLPDTAAFADPARRTEAVRYVLVGGEPVIDNGEPARARPGQVLRGPGYREILAPSSVVTGKPVIELSAVEQVVRSFLKRHRAPGASLAITDGGRLVYARGFGYADFSTFVAVQPDSLFRTASVSKPLTAVGILKLVEDGRLKLDDPAYPILGDIAPVPGQEDKVEPRLAKITIRHLLRHRGGWDRGVSFDAMFRPVEFAQALGLPPPAGPDAVIRNMMTQPLDFDPGERYAYSNFGYCLLGRIIEKLTGEPYEAWMQANVLKPVGASGMRLGRTHGAGRLPGEVRYYDPHLSPSVFADDLGQPVPAQYGGWFLEAMDAHGAWVASAVDLARFVCAVERPETSPLLRAETVKEMFALPAGEPRRTFYSLGWSNEPADSGGWHHSHNGALAGTATVIWIRPDGRNWVFLCNARAGAGISHFGTSLAPLLNAALDHTPQWPSGDLFAEFPAADPAAAAPDSPP